MTVEGFCSDLRDFLRLESPKSAVESMDFLRLRGSGVEAVYTSNGAEGSRRRRTRDRRPSTPGFDNTKYNLIQNTI